MIHHQKRTLGRAPALLVYDGSLVEAARNGCILFFHGLGVSKEANQKELEDLAGHGFLAVGIDNVGHGERRYINFETRLTRQNPNFSQDFLNAVRETAADVPNILDALTAEGLLLVEKVGLVGISMGGYITYTAIPGEPRLQAAVSILGSPYWSLDWPEMPAHHPDRFAKIKLLSQNAGLDETVPPEKARTFHEQLQALYDDYEARFDYVEYPRSGHFMREDDWAVCWQRTVVWFERHLSPKLFSP